MTTARFTMCTFNVHGWSDTDGDDNFDRVAAFLQYLNCDAVALQEVTDAFERAEELAGHLGMHETVASAGYGANVLLTRDPPVAVENVRTLGGWGERRSAAAATVEGPSGRLTIFATHLDHLDEDLRLEQFRTLSRTVARSGDAVILGDFNSLRMADYDARQAAHIHASRRAARIQPASGDVMRAIDEAGWVDLVRLHQARSIPRYLRSLSSEIPADLRETSAHWTRVDYVFATANLAARVDVSEGYVIDEQVTEAASDHRPVVVTVEPKRTAGRRAPSRRAPAG